MQAAIAQHAPFTKRGKQPVNSREIFLIFDEFRRGLVQRKNAKNLPAP
jgi:hypothetical protein